VYIKQSNDEGGKGMVKKLYGLEQCKASGEINNFLEQCGISTVQSKIDFLLVYMNAIDPKRVEISDDYKYELVKQTFLRGNWRDERERT
jgi:hypothetical protein